MPRPLAGSPDLNTSAADAILQSQQPEEEAEAESAELVEVQRAVPAKSEAKDPTERTNDPVYIIFNHGSIEWQAEGAPVVMHGAWQRQLSVASAVEGLGVYGDIVHLAAHTTLSEPLHQAPAIGIYCVEIH